MEFSVATLVFSDETLDFLNTFNYRKIIFTVRLYYKQRMFTHADDIYSGSKDHDITFVEISLRANRPIHPTGGINFENKFPVQSENNSSRRIPSTACQFS